MTDGRSILIIVNPIAGRGHGLRTADVASAELRARGMEVVVRHTRGRGDAERLTREACVDQDGRPDCIVGCGGDGTMQEVAHALASATSSLGDACPVMGLAPAGRCNDFSRALGVSTNPSVIVDVITRGRTQAVDLGRVNDRCFCTVATVGVDAEVTSFVDAMRLPLTGTLAYLYGAICVLARYRPRNLRIAGDFGEIEEPIFLASSANTASYGGAIKIAPDAVPTDGQLDLCVIKSVSRLRALALLPAVLAGRHRSFPEVRFIRTKRLTIDADEPLALWADGERIAQTPATIEVVPDAVRVLVRRDLIAT